VATLNTYVLIARDRLSPRKLRLIAEVPDAKRQAVYKGFEIREKSLWRQITRGDRFLYTIEALGNGDVGYGCQGYPQVQAYIDGIRRNPEALTNDVCTKRSQRLSDYYRVTNTSSHTETLLPPAPRASTHGARNRDPMP